MLAGLKISMNKILVDVNEWSTLYGSLTPEQIRENPLIGQVIHPPSRQDTETEPTDLRVLLRQWEKLYNNDK